MEIYQEHMDSSVVWLQIKSANLTWVWVSRGPSQDWIDLSLKKLKWHKTHNSGHMVYGVTISTTSTASPLQGIAMRETGEWTCEMMQL